MGLSLDYGQRHKKEIKHAASICSRLGCSHDVLRLHLPESMLTDSKRDIPNTSYAEITGVSPTYVPFRNGNLLAQVTAVAQARNFNAVYFGAHAEDAHNWAYPDCTPEFIGAMANAIYIGTYHKVRLHTPLMWLMKHEIIALGTTLNVPWENTWSCYAGGDLHCGICPTCRARHEAFQNAGVADPTTYEQDPTSPTATVGMTA